VRFRVSTLETFVGVSGSLNKIDPPAEWASLITWAHPHNGDGEFEE
jgi:hypothetical protein